MTNTQAYALRSLGIDGATEWPDFSGIAIRAYKSVVSVVAECASFFSGVGDSFFRAAKIRQTYKMLADLDDHMLKDIGISRDEIGAAAVHSASYPDIPYSRRTS